MPLRVPTPDLTLKCVLCLEKFVVPGHQAEWYASRGYSQPTRCPPCATWHRSPRATRPPAPPHVKVESRRCDVCGSTFTTDFAVLVRRRAAGQRPPTSCRACYLAIKASRADLAQNEGAKP